MKPMGKGSDAADRSVSSDEQNPSRPYRFVIVVAFFLLALLWIAFFAFIAWIDPTP